MVVTFDESQRWVFNDSEGVSIGDKDIKLEAKEKDQSYRAHIIGGGYGEIVDNYNITELFVYYSENNQYYGYSVYVPSSVRSIRIIRKGHDRWGNNLINLNNINKNLSFEVDDQNEVFSSDTCGSLYQNNKTELVHFCIGFDERDEYEISGIKTILPEAICKLRCRRLILPETLVSLKREAISGDIYEIIFKGQIQEIEDGALDGISQLNNCTIKINGLLSFINEEGQNELKKWYKDSSYKYARNLFFASPQPNGGKTLGNGFIELTEVLTIDEKLESQKDSCPVYFNSFINERFEKEKVTIPIIIRTIKISETFINRKYNFYSSQDVTEIKLADVRNNNTEGGFIYILVHETAERVLDLIHESFLKVK